MTSKTTQQEIFWAGDFGDGYISRNEGNELLASNIAMFSKILSSCDAQPRSVLEFGANVGMNIRALHTLLPSAIFEAVEINTKACQILSETGCQVVNLPISEYKVHAKFDLVLSKGVLIHLDPMSLPDTYRKMYESSSKWILVAEYYNPEPVGISYRGNSDKLFKRDFAGELLDLYPDLVLHDYGFAYHRDVYAQDDITWFLLKKGL